LLRWSLQICSNNIGHQCRYPYSGKNQSKMTFFLKCHGHIFSYCQGIFEICLTFYCCPWHKYWSTQIARIRAYKCALDVYKRTNQTTCGDAGFFILFNSIQFIYILVFKSGFRSAVHCMRFSKSVLNEGIFNICIITYILILLNHRICMKINFFFS